MKQQIQQISRSDAPSELNEASSQKTASRARGSTLLVLGHPSHELRIFHWLMSEKPTVFVLTDGSANRGFRVSQHTERYLDEYEIPRGSLFGAFPDREFYGHISGRNYTFFRSLAGLLVEEFSDPAVSRIVGDSIEGFNPTHDVCRMLIDAAVTVANSRRKIALQNFEFALVGPVLRDEDAGNERVIVLNLSERECDAKIRFAREYPGIAEDVERQVAHYGESSFSVECLRPADPTQLSKNLFPEKPPYERYGEERVRRGLYRDVLRYSEHVQQIQLDLCAWVEECGGKVLR